MEDIQRIATLRNRMNELYWLYSRETDLNKKKELNDELISLEDIFYPGEGQIIIKFLVNA